MIIDSGKIVENNQSKKGKSSINCKKRKKVLGYKEGVYDGDDGGR